MSRILPGDLFFMTEFGGSAWFTCISVTHTETRDGIPWSCGVLLKPDPARLVSFSCRSAKEVCVPEGWEWKQWDVVPYESGI